MTINEMLQKYTAGEKTLEETNEFLRKEKAGYVLDPYKHYFSPEEIMSAVAGETPEQANGYGLFDNGTGTYEKIGVTNGTFKYAMNMMLPEGLNEYAEFIIAGKTYQVAENKLVVKGSVKCIGDDAPHVQKKLNMGRRPEFAGTTQIQKCAQGTYEVTYNALGYAVKARRI